MGEWVPANEVEAGLWEGEQEDKSTDDAAMWTVPWMEFLNRIEGQQWVPVNELEETASFSDKDVEKEDAGVSAPDDEFEETASFPYKEVEAEDAWDTVPHDETEETVSFHGKEFREDENMWIIPKEEVTDLISEEGKSPSAGGKKGRRLEGGGQASESSSQQAELGGPMEAGDGQSAGEESTTVEYPHIDPISPELYDDEGEAAPLHDNEDEVAWITTRSPVPGFNQDELVRLPIASVEEEGIANNEDDQDDEFETVTVPLEDVARSTVSELVDGFTIVSMATASIMPDANQPSKSTATPATASWEITTDEDLVTSEVQVELAAITEGEPTATIIPNPISVEEEITMGPETKEAATSMTQDWISITETSSNAEDTTVKEQGFTTSGRGEYFSPKLIFLHNP